MVVLRTDSFDLFRVLATTFSREWLNQYSHDVKLWQAGFSRVFKHEYAAGKSAADDIEQTILIPISDTNRRDASFNDSGHFPYNNRLVGLCESTFLTTTFIGAQE